MGLLIGNVEGDELLMATCLSVGTRKYYIQFPNGTKYYLHGRYKTNGRFDRESVKKVLRKLNKDLDTKCDICLDVDYTDKEDLALFVIKKQIRKLYAMTNADVLNFYIGPTDKSNFRFASAITQPYKSDRPEKPSILNFLREYLITVEGATIAHGYEADDMLGMYQNDSTIAIHMDKDINMIPGRHFDTMTDTLWEASDPGEIYDSSASTVKGHGLALFYAQMLLGDRTDTIPGINRTEKQCWGVKGVYNLFQNCKDELSMLSIVVDCYQDSHNSGYFKEGLSCKQRLLEQADLVWICRTREEKGSDYISKKLEEFNINVY